MAKLISIKFYRECICPMKIDSRKKNIIFIFKSVILTINILRYINNDIH